MKNIKLLPNNPAKAWLKTYKKEIYDKLITNVLMDYEAWSDLERCLVLQGNTHEIYQYSDMGLKITIEMDLNFDKLKK